MTQPCAGVGTALQQAAEQLCSIGSDLTCFPTYSPTTSTGSCGCSHPLGCSWHNPGLLSANTSMRLHWEIRAGRVQGSGIPVGSRSRGRVGLEPVEDGQGGWWQPGPADILCGLADGGQGPAATVLPYSRTVPPLCGSPAPSQCPCRSLHWPGMLLGSPLLQPEAAALVMLCALNKPSALEEQHGIAWCLSDSQHPPHPTRHQPQPPLSTTKINTGTGKSGKSVLSGKALIAQEWISLVRAKEESLFLCCWQNCQSSWWAANKWMPNDGILYYP